MKSSVLPELWVTQLSILLKTPLSLVSSGSLTHFIGSVASPGSKHDWLIERCGHYKRVTWSLLIGYCLVTWVSLTVTHASEVIVDWVVKCRIGRSVGGSECCELRIIEML